MTLYECCRAWDEVSEERRADRAYQMLHQMGHGRVPFSARRYADLAGVEPERAEQLVTQARELGWIRYSDTAPGKPLRGRLAAGLFVGRLNQRRR